MAAVPGIFENLVTEVWRRLHLSYISEETHRAGLGICTRNVVKVPIFRRLGRGSR
jgi:hypothetical protein